MNRFISNHVPTFLTRFTNDSSSIRNQNENFELNISSSQQNHAESQETDTYEFKEISVNDCKDVSEALYCFNSTIIKDELEKLEEVLLLIIQLEQHFGTLRANELQQLTKKCKNKSIVVVFVSKNQDKFSIHWKSKETFNFFTYFDFKIGRKITTEEPNKFCSFLARFLAKSLSNQHLGLHNSILKIAEKEDIANLSFFADSRGFNLLLIAAESGQNDIVEILLDQKLETQSYNHNLEVEAQDLAWDAQHYNVVLTLLKAGVNFPKSFDISKCTIELREFCEKSDELHAAIIASNEAKIVEILDQTETLHPFYNTSNDSAAKVALDKNFIGIYELLVTRGVFLGRHEAFHNFWKNFNESDQEILRKIHFKNSIHTPEKHIADLANSSSVSHDDRNHRENLNRAKYSFRVLNQIPLIRIILMIVAVSRKLRKIIFDFKSTSVDVVDPSASSTVRGIFYTKGEICVGASYLLDHSKEHEVFGTLAHELSHFAMNLVYKNMARPYRRKDRERRREFKKISKFCEENRMKEEIIDMVFGYSRQRQHAELIARVPHLLAFYQNQPNKFEEVRDNFKCLFEFYEQKVVPDMEAALPRIEKEIKRMDQKILKNKIIAIMSVVMSVILLIVGLSVLPYLLAPEVLVPPSRMLSFVNLTRDDQIKVENAKVSYKKHQLQFKDLFLPNSTAYYKLLSDHISLMLKGDSLDFDEMLYLDKLVKHEWKTMSKKLREIFLSLNFTFQNESVNFGTFIEKCSKCFDLLTSEQITKIFNGKEFKIDKMISNRKFFVERFFRDENVFEIYWYFLLNVQYSQKWADRESEEKFRTFYDEFIGQNASIYEQKMSMAKINEHFRKRFKDNFFQDFSHLLSFKSFHENFEQILNKTEKSGLFVLSSEAGTGKTMIFRQFTMKIKNLYPNRWVSYIDLKDFIKFYNKTGYVENVLNLLEDIIGFSSSNEFERKMFQELYKSGEVVLLWNGFDEISPTYSDFILNVLSFIREKSKNIQFICTRPLYENLIWNKFGISSHEILPFDKDKEKEFLIKYVNASKVDEKNVDESIAKIYKIVDNLNEKAKYENRKMTKDSQEDFNTPLMLEMIADLIGNNIEIEESENLWQIYKKFIERKTLILMEKSYFEPKFAQNFIFNFRNFDMIRIFQMYALKIEIPYLLDGNKNLQKEIFRKLQIFRRKIPKELTCCDKISQMGILYINGENEFRFAHKTFAEFFVALFFIENIYHVESLCSKDTELIVYLFNNITEMYGAKQVIITKFINSFLQLQNSNKNEGFKSKISNIFRRNYSEIFFKFLDRDQPEIFKFLFGFFKKDHQLLIDMLHVHKNETLHTTAFTKALEKSQHIPELLRKLGKTVLTSNEYEKFIYGKDMKGIIAFTWYNSYRTDLDRNITSNYDQYELDKNILDCKNKSIALELIVQNLTKNEISKLLLSPLSPVRKPENFDMLKYENFWIIVNNSLSHKHKKNLISNILQEASRVESVSYSLPITIAKAKIYLTDSEIFKIFLKKNIIEKSAAFYGDFSKVNLLYDFFANHTNKNQQMKLWQRKIEECAFIEYPSFNNTKYCPQNLFAILLVTSKIPENEKIDNLKNFLKKFDINEVIEIIRISNYFFPHFIRKSNPKQCVEFAEFLTISFNGKEDLLKEFLLRKVERIGLNIFELGKSKEILSSKLDPFVKLLDILTKD